MKKLSTSLLLLLVLLTGCGGGGSAQPEPESKPIIPKPISQFETPATISVDKFRLAKIDYRYDTPKNQFDINGHQTTSFESIKQFQDDLASRKSLSMKKSAKSLR